MRARAEIREREPIPTLAYLGPAGTFTELAAVTLQAKPGYMKAQLVECNSITGVCELVAQGGASYGVVPIENSTGGDVKDTMRALTTLNLQIIDELVVPISQSLYMQDTAQVTRIVTKDQAYYQSGRYLQEYFPGYPFEPVDSTALSVQMAAEDPTIAAIGSSHAARVLGVADKLIKIDGIEDNPANVTTFVVVQKPGRWPRETDHDKTTVLLSLPDKPGSLFDYLEALKIKNINLNKIRSFGRVDGFVNFLVSVDGHYFDNRISSGLLGLTGSNIGIKMLGSYPATDYTPPEMSGIPDITHAVEQIKQEMQNGNGIARDEAVVFFTLENRAGALRDALEPFARRGINLSGIDSLPTRRKLGEYVFYLVFDKTAPDKERALQELETHCTQVILL